MKRKIAALVLAIAIVCTCLFAFVACDNDKDADPTPTPACNHVDTDGDGKCDNCGKAMESDIVVDPSLLGTTYKITMWVSETVKKDADGNQVDSVVEMTKRQIARFCQETGLNIEASIEGVTEADAGSKVVADVATAPDIYCFAQDQLARLVQAAALAAPGKKAQAYIGNINDESSVNAAKVAGTLYAYPMTSDNGYFLYYDTSVVSNPESLEAIIADCNAAGKKFRFALENAWYTASFFFATDCHSNWTTDADGNWTGVDDDFNSANGLIAMKGMQKLAQAECYNSNADVFDDCAAIVTGTWNSQTAATFFGDNLGATDLPSFTVDGNEYHLGSYFGSKLMGVKPQEDVKRGAVLQLLAQYLTSDECQMERFDTFGWGPSSKISQDSEAVKADPSLSAVYKQKENAVLQSQIHGSWWDIAKVLGAEAKTAKSDADLQTALTNYKNSIDALFKMSEEQKQAWSVIGSIGGTNWDTDFTMTPNDDKTVWTSVEINATKGEEFKVRQGASWEVNYGANGVMNGGNIAITENGTYVIVLTLNGDNATITWTKK